MNFGLIPVFFMVVLLIVSLSVGFPKGSESLFLFLYAPIVFLILLTVCFIMNLLSVEVSIDDYGITYRSRISNKKTSWDDVASVNRKYIYSGGFPSYGPPRDLQFQLKNNKKIDVLYFVLNLENDNWDEDGMPEFESDVKKYWGEIA